MSFAILNDVTRCKGCNGCTLACKEANGLPRDGDWTELSATTWTSVTDYGGLNVRRQCMHCQEPTCASACPVGALAKTEAGPVIYDESRCIGCRYCILACPFGIPTYEWSSATPRVRKCIMCYDKALRVGKQPACTSVCPTGATVFGERDALLAEAKRRISSSPERYYPHVYGETEAGGTNVLYLSPVPFEEIGFNAGLRHESYPLLTWRVLSNLPPIVSIAGAGLVGIWWITKRRQDVYLAEHAGGADEAKEAAGDSHVGDEADAKGNPDDEEYGR